MKVRAGGRDYNVCEMVQINGTDCCIHGLKYTQLWTLLYTLEQSGTNNIGYSVNWALYDIVDSTYCTYIHIYMHSAVTLTHSCTLYTRDNTASLPDLPSFITLCMECWNNRNAIRETPTHYWHSQSISVANTSQNHCVELYNRKHCPQVQFKNTSVEIVGLKSQNLPHLDKTVLHVLCLWGKECIQFSNKVSTQYCSKGLSG